MIKIAQSVEDEGCYMGEASSAPPSAPRLLASQFACLQFARALREGHEAPTIQSSPSRGMFSVCVGAMAPVLTMALLTQSRLLLPRVFPFVAGSSSARTLSTTSGSSDDSDADEPERYTLVDDDAHNELRAAARAAGVQWKGWDIAMFPELDVRGAVALEHIPAGQPLGSVPVAAGITIDAATPCPFPPDFAHPDAWNEWPQRDLRWRMALNLFWERSRGQVEIVVELGDLPAVHL